MTIQGWTMKKMMVIWDDVSELLILAAGIAILLLAAQFAL